MPKIIVAMKKTNKVFSVALLLLLFCVSNSCLMEEPLKTPFSTLTPPDIGDGWVITEPVREHIDEAALKTIYYDIHSDHDLWQIKSLLVFRNNHLVAESYMKTDDDRVNGGAVWSCTKQVTAILTGMAIDHGLITLGDTIGTFFPEASVSKKGITIENLLTMKSGIAYENGGYFSETQQLTRKEPSNSLNFVLDLGMSSTPGTTFHYNDGNPQIISAIIQKQTGKSLNQWAAENLFNKLGITHLSWLAYKDGITMGAWGILTTPRELAKFGHLVLNEGKGFNNGGWDGPEIVSSGWISDMTSVKVTPAETGEAGKAFGYFWWLDTGRSISAMWGQGGQYVFVNKSKNLVVVITSEPNTQDDFQLTFTKGLSIYDRIEKCLY